jgi:hypothetical protein
MCQHLEAQIVSTNPNYHIIDSTMYVDICQGETVSFTAQGIYQNTTYAQSDATSTFDWEFGDGSTDSGTNLTDVSHTYTNGGGYNVHLTITDDKGCQSTNDVTVRIRTSMTPSFDGTTLDPPAICPEQVVTLNGHYQIPYWTNEITPVHADTTFLPDGNGVCYETNIDINNFDPGQTLDDINQLLGICMNIEHSYIGDLTMYIICPNGTQVQMEAQQGGGVFLGDANDGSSNPGTGFTYCISPNPTYNGTLGQAASNGHTVGVSQGSAVDPNDSYASYESLSALVGCPLNGTWTIRI